MMERILTNWPIKLVSLIFSISLWFYVVQGTNPMTNREFNNFPVTIKNQESLELTIIEPENPTVSFKVRGRRNVLNRLRRSDIEVVANMEGVSGTATSIELSYHVPDDVVIVERSHSDIVFAFDKEITTTKKIEVNKIGELPSNELEINSIDLDYDNVEITGYSKNIDEIDKVLVDLNLEDINKDSIIQGEIKILDKNNNLMNIFVLNRHMVSISVKLIQVKEVPINIVVENKPDDFNLNNIKMSPDKVKIKGPSEILNRIKDIKTEPINLIDITTNKTLDIELVVPNGVVLTTENSVQANITISENNNEATENNSNDKQIEFVKNNSDILIKNKTGNKVVNFLDNNPIKVSVFGEDKYINQVNSEDISIFIDVKNLDIGEYELPITVNELSNIKKIIINPAKYRISIK